MMAHGNCLDPLSPLNKKNFVKVGPTLKIISGSAQVASAASKAQISLCTHEVWSEFSIGALWVDNGPGHAGHSLPYFRFRPLSDLPFLSVCVLTLFTNM